MEQVAPAIRAAIKVISCIRAYNDMANIEVILPSTAVIADIIDEEFRESHEKD